MIGPPSPVPSSWTSASSGPGGCAPTLLTCDSILSLFCSLHVLTPVLEVCLFTKFSFPFFGEFIYPRPVVPKK